MKKMIFTVIICLLSLSTSVYAQDMATEVPGPYLQVMSQLHVDNIDISISKDRVSYTYTVSHSNEGPLLVNFTLPVAPYAWIGAIQSVYKNGYNNLTVAIDGQKKTLQKKTQAFFQGKDITAELNALGMDPVFEDVLEYSSRYQSTIKEHPEIFSHKYMSKMCDDNCDKEENIYYVPEWTVAVSYLFNYEFPPQKSTVIHYEYEPIWGYALDLFREAAAWKIFTDGGSVMEVYDALGVKPDDTAFVQWLTLPVTSLGTAKLLENISISISGNPNEKQFVYAVLGAHTAYGTTEANITIANEPVAGPLKILLLQKR